MRYSAALWVGTNKPFLCGVARMKRLLHIADAWWPTLSPDGRDLVAGNTFIKAWHLPAITREDQPAHWAIGFGRNGRFLRPSVITYTSERSALTAERFEYDLRVGLPSPMADDFGLVAGNEFEAADGHWASWLDADQRVTYDGKLVAYGVRGVKVAGDLLLYKTQSQLVVRNMRTGTDARYPLPPKANNVTLTPDGYIGYGYYWDARVIAPQFETLVPYRDEDVTVTPWRQESAPVLCRAKRDGLSVMWAWTFTERPGDKRALVLGRPLHDANSSAILIEDFIADAHLSVVYRQEDDRWIVAGNASAGGVMSVWQVPYDTPRIPVVDVGGAEPEPQPEEDVVNAPGITVTEYGKELTPAGSWRLRFNDRNNDCNVTVSIVNGRLTVEMSNSKGTDRTGSVRQVTIHD